MLSSHESKKRPVLGRLSSRQSQGHHRQLHALPRRTDLFEYARQLELSDAEEKGYRRAIDEQDNENQNQDDENQNEDDLNDDENEQQDDDEEQDQEEDD